MPEQMAKSKFLALSTRVMEDLKKWVEEARDYYDLAPDRLATMLSAIEYVDHVTVQVAKVKEANEENTNESKPSDGDMVVVADGENYRVISWPNRKASIVNLAHDRNEARKEACDAADRRSVKAWDETPGRMELIDCVAGWTVKDPPAEN